MHYDVRLTITRVRYLIYKNTDIIIKSELMLLENAVDRIVNAINYSQECAFI